MLRTADDGWRPGWDFAGILQSDVDDSLRTGARVLGIRQGETWAERVAVPTNWVAGLPEGVSFAEGAALPTAGWRRCGCSASGLPSSVAECSSRAPRVGSDALRFSSHISVAPR